LLKTPRLPRWVWNQSRLPIALLQLLADVIVGGIDAADEAIQLQSRGTKAGLLPPSLMELRRTSCFAHNDG
jgi:hypothetical protein